VARELTANVLFENADPSAIVDGDSYIAIRLKRHKASPGTSVLSQQDMLMSKWAVMRCRMGLTALTDEHIVVKQAGQAGQAGQYIQVYARALGSFIQWPQSGQTPQLSDIVLARNTRVSMNTCCPSQPPLDLTVREVNDAMAAWCNVFCKTFEDIKTLFRKAFSTSKTGRNYGKYLLRRL